MSAEEIGGAFRRSPSARSGHRPRHRRDEHDDRPQQLRPARPRRDPSTRLAANAPANPPRSCAFPTKRWSTKSFRTGKLEAIMILPIEGYGLWSVLYGYLALDPPTLRRSSASPTTSTRRPPGSAGEVDNPRWKALWKGARHSTSRWHASRSRSRRAPRARPTRPLSGGRSLRGNDHEPRRHQHASLLARPGRIRPYLARLRGAAWRLRRP